MVGMNEQEFSDLVESIKQAGEIKRGQREPGRVFEFTPMDIKKIRHLPMPYTHIVVVVKFGLRGPAAEANNFVLTAYLIEKF
jgi:hypothetical protein